MSTDIFSSKKEKNLSIKKELGLDAKIKPLGLIKLNNKALIRDLRDGLVELKASFVIEVAGIENEKIGDNIVAVSKVKPADISGFDFIICDDDIENIDIYLKGGVAPIIKKDSYLSSILKEFNPMKNEGNAYFYDSETKWLIFSAIVRYIENYKFPFDNKNLVKNVLSA